MLKLIIAASFAGADFIAELLIWCQGSGIGHKLKVIDEEL